MPEDIVLMYVKNDLSGGSIMKKHYETPKLVVLGDIKDITQLGIWERAFGRNGRGSGRSPIGGGSGEGNGTSPIDFIFGGSG